MCHRHSAKNKKHSAKALPSVTLSQTVHGNYSVGKQLFAECFLSRTRQMVCRVSNLTLDKKKWFAECFTKYTRQRIIVCRVFLGITLGKPIFQRKNNNFFSQHTIIVCRVFLGITLDKPIFKEKNNFFLSIFQFNSCHTKYS